MLDYFKRKILQRIFGPWTLGKKSYKELGTITICTNYMTSCLGAHHINDNTQPRKHAADFVFPRLGVGRCVYKYCLYVCLFVNLLFSVISCEFGSAVTNNDF